MRPAALALDAILPCLGRRPGNDHVARLEAKIARLEARLALREEEIARLIGDIDPLVVLGRRLGLAPRQAEFLAVLMSGGIVPRSRVEMILYGFADAVPSAATFNTMIHHMRRRLARFGIGIETVSGIGWRLTTEARARLAALDGEDTP